MNWINQRLRERTSLDGLVLVLVGATILFLGPIAKIAAYVAIAYGIWTIIKKEK